MSKLHLFDPSSSILSPPIAVRFAETDLMGVVHHATYISWLEMGRIAWLEAVGVPYTEVAASGHHFAVTGVHAEYRASCTFGDSVVIATSLAQLRSRQVAFVYQVRHATENTLLVTGLSEHICVDLGGAMARIPADLLERLKTGAEALLHVD